MDRRRRRQILPAARHRRKSARALPADAPERIVLDDLRPFGFCQDSLQQFEFAGGLIVRF
jgi:hypothetical protein